MRVTVLCCVERNKGLSVSITYGEEEKASNIGITMRCKWEDLLTLLKKLFDVPSPYDDLVVDFLVDKARTARVKDDKTLGRFIGQCRHKRGISGHLGWSFFCPILLLCTVLLASSFVFAQYAGTMWYYLISPPLPLYFLLLPLVTRSMDCFARKQSRDSPFSVSL